jgi:hypothetical protein
MARALARVFLAILFGAATLPAAAEGQTLPADAPAGATFLESVSVPAGTKTLINSKTTFSPDTSYTLIVGGSATYTQDLGDKPPAGVSPESFSEDALYCFQAPPKVGCPGGKSPPTEGPGLVVSDSVTSRLDQLAGNLNGISYHENHIYAASFTGHNSKLGFSDRQASDTQVKHAGGWTVDVYENGGGGCSKTRAVGSAAAINDVRVTKCSQACQVHRDGTPPAAWIPMEKDMVLKQGDDISCDPDGGAELSFADNSTVKINPVTMLKIAGFFTEGGVVRTEILLKMGEVAAQVNKSEATKSDFRIVGPTDVSSVRGTKFRMFVDPGSGATLVSTQEGVVSVDPVRAGLPTRQVTAGKEVFVTKTAITKVASTGKAGARGGVNLLKAVDLLTAKLARSACSFTTPHLNAFSTRPAKGGWRITVKTTGKVKGTSSWLVVRGKVRPSGALAKRIATGCR